MLDKKLMIAKLHIKSWSGRKIDEQVSIKTCTDMNAKTDAGRFSKMLVPKTALQPVSQAENEVRRFHFSMTVPWEDGGTRALPAKNYLRYTNGMRSRKLKFDTEVTKFINQYPTLKGNAPKELGNMYKTDEYPSTGEMKTLFGVYTEIKPLPTADDFRVNLDELEVHKIKKELNEQNKKDQEAAMKNIWHRLYEVVETMANGMRSVNGKNGKVYDSYFENIEKLTEILPDLNIMDDEALNDMCREVKNNLGNYSPSQVRKDPKLKAQIVETADDIMNKMGSFMGMGQSVQ